MLSVFFFCYIFSFRCSEAQLTYTECYTQGGPPYNGTKNHTANGEPCLPWSEFTHLSLRRNWNESVARENSNFCRNPDDDPRGPWCMVTRAKYGTCAIPHCEHISDCYDGNGEDYLGEANLAENSEPCIPWVNVIRAEKLSRQTSLMRIVRHNGVSNTSDMSILSEEVQSFNSCRNPSGKMSKPWCYVSRSDPTNTHVKTPCMIEQCDRSTQIGFPLDFGDECPPGFISQIGKSASSKGEISTVYCSLTTQGLKNAETEGQYKSFCLFLLNHKQEMCPKGFEMKRSFMRVKLTNVGKYSMFRSDGQNSIWLVLCCTNGSHVEKRTIYPTFDITYVRPTSNVLRRRSWQSRDSLKLPNQVSLSTMLDMHPGLIISRKRRTEQSVDKSIPSFVSIDRCPPVPGKKRKVFTLGTWQSSILTSTLMDYGYYTFMCIYYEDEQSIATVGESQTLVPLILVEGKECPANFVSASNEKLFKLFIYLRSAFILCKPEGVYRDDAIDKLLPAGNQCFVSNLPSGSQSENNDEFHMENQYLCPQGYERNVVKWSGNNSTTSEYTYVSISFCCRKSTFENEADSVGQTEATQYPIPSYLRQTVAFATLMMDSNCPDYVDHKSKLSAEFIPVMQTEQYSVMELIGSSDPVGFIDSMRGVRGVLSLCKYTQPRDEVGILSTNGICLGVGYRNVPTVQPDPGLGAMCAANVTGLNFAPGSYCFYKTSTTCPNGLAETQTNLLDLLVRSFLLQTMLSPNSNHNDEKELCCQTEESFGAIPLPLNITAAFSLPAQQGSCQAFVGFSVDQTKGLCEYTPITEPPQSIIVWPRRVFPSHLRGKTEIVQTCSSKDSLNALSKSSKTQRFMTRQRKIWLVPTPMQDFSSNEAMEICFVELEGSKVPFRNEKGSLNYCIAVFASCPNEGFEAVAAYPYQQYVVCCTKETPQQSEIPSEPTWPDFVKTVVTLGYKTSEDEENVRDLTGPTEVHRDLKKTESDFGCPTFDDYTIIRRFVKIWNSKRQKTFWLRPSVQQLLNLTIATDKDVFANRTGMWIQDGVLYAIHCEFQSNRPATVEDDTLWPMDNYAIPKPVTDCPPQFTASEFVHLQGNNGFHYSQPIHLDGEFILHSIKVKLHYCQRNQRSFSDLPNKSNAATLPPGHYCVLQVGRKCPAGFTSGSLSVFEGVIQINESENETSAPFRESKPSSTADLSSRPRILRDKFEKSNTGISFDRVTYMFCCRADSPSASIPIGGFPSNTGPFYLYRAGETCQEIAGLRVTDEHICIDAPEFLVGKRLHSNYQLEVVDKTYQIEGFTPTVSMTTKHCNVKINLCYYEPTVSQVEETWVNPNNGSMWPPGAYSLLTTIRENDSLACPPGFSLDIRRNIPQDVILNTFFRPMSFIEYFTQKLPDFGVNASLPTLHTCKRNVTDSPVSYSITGMPNWPSGNYCVLMDLELKSCPQGLHRYTRQLAELCCHRDTTNSTLPIKLPFIGDFFVMGAFDEPDLECIEIENTHVEKYVLLLFSSTNPHLHSLCHYLPLGWLNTSHSWPIGDYLLPIGRRGIPMPALQLEDSLSHRLQPYFCPEGFQRIQHHYEMFDEAFGEDKNIEIFKTGQNITLDFCQRQKNTTNDTIEASQTVWPKGDYCIISVGPICPPEMHASNELIMRVPRSHLTSIRNTNEFGEPIGENLYTVDREDHITYYSVCCREDRRLVMHFPSFSGGMYLPAGSTLCSSIPGTFIEQELVTTYLDPTLIDAQSISNEGDAYRFSRDSIFPAPFIEPGVMSLCYYHQMQHSGNNSNESTGILEELLEPGTTAMSLWLAKECGCAENAYCRPFKRFSCKCKKGYFGDGVRVCREITPLTDSCGNLCHTAAECVIRTRHSLGSRLKEETTCICKEGYVGDGFHCLAECSSHICQPFSKCNIRRGAPVCECVPGTIHDGDKCNFDIYSSFQVEKDLPQYMLQHLNCFNDEVAKSLILQQPKRYFLIFAPPKILTTCNDILSHIVMLENLAEYNKVSSLLYTEVTSLNSSIIAVNNTNGTFINGKPILTKTVIFTNGLMYSTAEKLEVIAGTSRYAVNITAVVICISILIILILLIGLFILRKKHPQLFKFDRYKLRRSHFSQTRASWRGSSRGLVASEIFDDDN